MTLKEAQSQFKKAILLESQIKLMIQQGCELQDLRTLKETKAKAEISALRNLGLRV